MNLAQGTRFDPQAMLNMGVTLYINDQAKQRYFNPSRYLIMTTRFADAQRNLDMDQVTWNQVQTNPIGQIANQVQPKQDNVSDKLDNLIAELGNLGHRIDKLEVK
jgi:hypothetical protein